MDSCLFPGHGYEVKCKKTHLVFALWLPIAWKCFGIMSRVNFSSFNFCMYLIVLHSAMAREFTATSRIMQSSSNELSTLVSCKAKMLTNETYYIMTDNSRADVVRLLAERYDTKFNTCLATLKSCLTAKQSISRRLYIYIYIWENLELNPTLCIAMKEHKTIR